MKAEQNNKYDITKVSSLKPFDVHRGFCVCSYQNLKGWIPISPSDPTVLQIVNSLHRLVRLELGFGKLNWRPHPLIYVVFLMIHMLDLGGRASQPIFIWRCRNTKFKIATLICTFESVRLWNWVLKSKIFAKKLRKSLRIKWSVSKMEVTKK